MIVSHKYRFIFLRTEKTASTSMIKALQGILDENDVQASSGRPSWAKFSPIHHSALRRHCPQLFGLHTHATASQVRDVGQIANLIVAQMLHLESQDPDKDISLYINSPGGSIYAGLAIYDTMNFIKPDVATMCVGIAMSMGSLLLAGGAPGKRMALPNSRILIHQPSAGFEGQSSDIEIHAREILKTRKRIDEIYAKHTGRPEEEVHRDMERDRFFKADQAAEYGLIDRVIKEH